MQSDPYDIVVIGAGVVGCAMARRFTLDGARVLVLEKALDVLDGASKGNSAILHTGFDAPPGSLEQACISAGYAEYLKIADSLSLPILKSGAMVIAWTEDQLGALPDLIKKAHQNGISNVKALDRAEILKREPQLSEDLLGGFEIPGEFLIDPWCSAHAYILQALGNGAELRREAEVLNGEFGPMGWTLNTSIGQVNARQVINCAGLYGDVVDARLLGANDFTVSPRKGQFVVFDKAASALVSSIILPVPTKTTKGIVVCRTIFGNVLVGPTAEDQTSRTNSSTGRSALLDLRARGIEMIPGLEHCEVTAAYAGLRPATEFSDYQIRHYADKAYMTVGGIRSTGLSAALGIARYVSNQLQETGIKFKPLENPFIPSPDRLSEYHGRDWQNTGGEGIVCHCELVTRREINRVLNGPMSPGSLQGLKRRTRVTMGRCQGFYCTAELAEMTAGKLKIPIDCSNG
ncbi:FAD/NAD(P)-binding oxidoreductase [Chromatiales bacterium (ex Bugula neritina AB1)]|nr:FAD/NAD(P)-binding oxidoreductase [Chromatiales bacterium (ex Bugula neritina AB1)]